MANAGQARNYSEYVMTHNFCKHAQGYLKELCRQAIVLTEEELPTPGSGVRIQTPSDKKFARQTASKLNEVSRKIVQYVQRHSKKNIVIPQPIIREVKSSPPMSPKQQLKEAILRQEANGATVAAKNKKWEYGDGNVYPYSYPSTGAATNNTWTNNTWDFGWWDCLTCGIQEVFTSPSPLDPAQVAGDVWKNAAPPSLTSWNTLTVPLFHPRQ